MFYKWNCRSSNDKIVKCNLFLLSREYIFALHITEICNTSILAMAKNTITIKQITSICSYLNFCGVPVVQSLLVMTKHQVNMNVYCHSYKYFDTLAFCWHALPLVLQGTRVIYHLPRVINETQNLGCKCHNFALNS